MNPFEKCVRFLLHKVEGDALWYIMRSIQKAWPMDSGEAHMYRMHIYQAGGMFKPYRDTAYDFVHLATLIVNMTPDGADSQEKSRLGAFFADYLPEVTPVVERCCSVLH